MNEDFTMHFLLMAHEHHACKADGASQSTLDAGRWHVLGLEARDIEQHIAPSDTLSLEFRHQATLGSGRTEDHRIYSSN